MIAQHSIDALKAQLDIVDVISHYVEVKRNGGSFACVCPFHDDKNPSMSISQNKGFYHCFGCGASGDAFRFVMDYERLNYAQAVEKVASLCHFALVYTQEKRQLDEKKMLENLGVFYKESLGKQKDALDYLASRRLPKSVVEKFEIGYAGSSKETLDFLKNNGFELKEAVTLGVVKGSKEELYASFINRVTFAIRDANGKLVGFGGRTISNHPAKYVNSPESVIFNKSKLLYAYDKAKKSIAQKGEVVICEGYMDCISLHLAGVTNAVAVLGTALTPQHLPLLKREGLKVVLCFDADAAGLEASFRSAKLLFSNGIDGFVTQVSSGKDPADMVFEGKEAELKLLLGGGVEFGEFILREIVRRQAPKTPLEVEATLRKAQAFFAQTQIENKGAIAKMYEKILASQLGLEAASVELLSSGANEAKPAAKTRRAQAYEPLVMSDKAEAFVLKNMLENREFLGFVKRDGGEGIFKNQRLYRAICGSQSANNPAIHELELYIQNNNFTPCATLQAFEAEYLGLKIRYFSSYLKEIARLDGVGIEEKIAAKKSVENEILRLKNRLNEIRAKLI